jgi:hypothetical protein
MGMYVCRLLHIGHLWTLTTPGVTWDPEQSYQGIQRWYVVTDPHDQVLPP